MDEYVDVVDENDNLIEIKLKSHVHNDGRWHRVANVWILNYKGEILLQKRSPDKETFANLWDVSSAGHLKAGEDYESAAIRELEEELGVEVGPEELTFLWKHSVQEYDESKGILDREFQKVYFLNLDWKIDRFEIQNEEISKIEFFKADRLKQMYDDPDWRKLLCPSKEYCFKVIDKIERMNVVRQNP